MRIELEALQPQLQESAKQTAAMLVDIEIQSKQAGETREVVVAEEAIVNAKAVDANKLKVLHPNFPLINFSKSKTSSLGRMRT